MTYEMMYLLGLILLLGFVASKIAEKLKLPTISTYVLIGILLSPSVAGIISEELLAQSEFIVHTVLGVIAFIIGGSIKIDKMRQEGWGMIVLLLFEALGAFVMVTAGMMLALPWLSGYTLNGDTVFVLSLLLGALSCTTAPAATLAIIHEYRSRGSLSDAILAIVAMDDILGVLLFAWVTALIIFGLSTDALTAASFWKPLWTIILSLLFGALLGGVLAYTLTHTKRMHSMIVVSFSLVSIGYALAVEYHLEPLIVTVILGFVTSNFSYAYKLVAHDIKLHFEQLFFVPFFILAGAHFDLDSFHQVWPIALFYVLMRVVGKVVGSFLGAVSIKSGPKVRNYLGLSLMPQAGVVIGLGLLLQQYDVLDAYTPMMLSIIITAVTINEIVGPILTRFALLSSGEAKEIK